jgi:hypothetical protein
MIFYALNVQTICDRMKRFIWASGMHKGSLHDSVAFVDTTLMTFMTSMAAKLKKTWFFNWCRLCISFAEFHKGALYQFD